MSDDPIFYKCSNDHYSASPKPLTKCPQCIKGMPCLGTLIEVTANGNPKRLKKEDA